MTALKVANAVKYVFKNHPLLANSVVYGTLYVGAEFSQQTVSRKFMVKDPKPLDTSVIGRYAIMGTGAYGPILFTWYKWLDNKYVGTATRVVLKKLLLDQFLLTPPLLVIFFVGMSIMEGKKDVYEECRTKIASTFQTSCFFWLPAQTVNFLLVPPAFRVIYVGSCAFLWVNILCWIKRQPIQAST